MVNLWLMTIYLITIYVPFKIPFINGPPAPSWADSPPGRGRRHHRHRVARGERGAAHIGARGGTWGVQGVGNLVIRGFRGVYMVFIWYLYDIYMVFIWYLDGI